MPDTPARHHWIAGADRDAAEALAALLRPAGMIVSADAHRRLRGPYTAAGTLLRQIVPGLLHSDPALVERHDVEILTAAPELDGRVVNRRATLTSMADPEERTRFYPRAHTLRIAHGLCDLLLAWAAAAPGRPVIALARTDEADATDAELAAILLRRCDPETLTLVIATTGRPPSALADALRAHARRVVTTDESARRPARRPAPHPTGDQLAAAYVGSECLSADPQERAAYEALHPHKRARMHDRRADELEARAEVSLRLGVIPFHRERGCDPAGAGLAALCAALERCVLTGCYHAVLELGERAQALLDPAADPERAWLVTAKVVTALTALGRPDEAAAEYDAACAQSTLPIAHLQAAYGRAMLYTRFYEDRRRDHQKAKAWINTAIALAGQLPEEEWRTFNLTLNENGLALIEMHLGDLGEALRLIDDGLERCDRDLGPERQTLHRSVLRYNRAQLLARMGHPDALTAYDELIAIDPNHSEYRLERAALLRRAGRAQEALADLDAAIALSPPYPEAHYNRGDLRLERGDLPGAIADFTRVLELDPQSADALLNRASARCDAGDHVAALRDVDDGLGLAPGSAHLLGLRGTILHHQGDTAGAEHAYAAAVAADPALLEVWANRAALALHEGDGELAAAHLHQALEHAQGPERDVYAELLAQVETGALA